MGKKTIREKERIMRDFFSWCGTMHIQSLDDITAAKAYAFLSKISDERGPNVANVYRKNLMAAWKWGLDFFENFPQIISPISNVKKFPTPAPYRYVPPEEDIIKVLCQAEGQDLVMLMTLYYTGARKGEIFRLRWEDVDFNHKKIRLMDKKTGTGKVRIRWLQMHPELIKALAWWYKNRPCKVDNVFMQHLRNKNFGKPYVARSRFLRTLCTKVGVKPFGFHAIRHKSAAITFSESGLNFAQVLLGHTRATTTDQYVKSAGLYSDQNPILAALGSSEIGQMVGDLLEKKLPQSGDGQKKKCNLKYVTY